MKKVNLGLTDIIVSQIGLGTVKFGRNQGVKYPEQFSLPSDRDIQFLLDHAQALGVNLLDTAPAYGNSEERIGKAIKHQRQQWVLSSKVGEEFVNGVSSFDFTPKAIVQSVERSLYRLQTDFIDILLVHSNGEDEKLILEDRIFEVLSALKQRGLIRAYGMSTKTEQGGKLALDYADLAMVTYNPIQKEEKSVIDYAHLKNKGIFIKKALASGHLHQLGESPIEAAMKFIFAAEGVTSVILGTLNQAHLTQVVNAV